MAHLVRRLLRGISTHVFPRCMQRQRPPDPARQLEHLADVAVAATDGVPEDDAFWSITVYGSDGFMKSDDNTDD